MSEWWRADGCSWDTIPGTQIPPWENGGRHGYGTQRTRMSGQDLLERDLGLRAGSLADPDDDDGDCFETGATPYRPATRPSPNEWGPADLATPPLILAAIAEAEVDERAQAASLRENLERPPQPRAVPDDVALVRVQEDVEDLVASARLARDGDAEMWRRLRPCPFGPPGHLCHWQDIDTAVGKTPVHTSYMAVPGGGTRMADDDDMAAWRGPISGVNAGYHWERGRPRLQEKQLPRPFVEWLTGRFTA